MFELDRNFGLKPICLPQWTIRVPIQGEFCLMTLTRESASSIFSKQKSCATFWLFYKRQAALEPLGLNVNLQDCNRVLGAT